MPIDDNPIDALEKQLQMEILSASPVPKVMLDIAALTPLPWPFNKVIDAVKRHLAADPLERIRLLLETCRTEIGKHETDIKQIRAAMSVQELRAHEEISWELMLDAARRAESTCAKERVKRIGLILANAVTESSRVDGDEAEEMMRVAMELSDREIGFLKELIRIEGAQLQTQDHIPRYDAHMKWEQGRWGNRVDPEIDSVFSKLESYGLVARIAPPTNQNILADYQNRYVLLRKGARFAALARAAKDA